MLYLNGAAKDAIERAGVQITTTDIVDEAPKGHGLISRTYRFTNPR